MKRWRLLRVAGTDVFEWRRRGQMMRVKDLTTSGRALVRSHLAELRDHGGQ